MNQNKTLFWKLNAALLSLVMTFTTGLTPAQASNSLPNLSATMTQKYQVSMPLDATGQQLKDNAWVGYLIGEGERYMHNANFKTHSLAETSPDPSELKRLWDLVPNNIRRRDKYMFPLATNNFSDAKLIEQNQSAQMSCLTNIGETPLSVGSLVASGGGIAAISCNGVGSNMVDVRVLEMRVWMQDQVNKAFTYGPQLHTLLKEEKYDEAFKYAHQHGMMRMITTPIGVQALGIAPFNLDQMTRFYRAGVSNYTLARSTGRIYRPRLWQNSCGPEKHAAKNFNNNDFGKYPGFAYFCSKKKKQSLLKKIAGVVVGIAIGVVTAGIGSAISAGITGAIGSTTAAGVTTIAGVSVASGTLGGTVLTIASNALATGIVAAAQGGNFGDALKSGLVGGVVGAAVGGIAGDGIPNLNGDGNLVGGLNLNDSIANSLGGGAVAQQIGNYTTATIVGTGSNAILNGGDLGSAFQNAAFATSLQVLQDGAVAAVNRLRQPASANYQGPTADTQSLVDANLQSIVDEANAQIMGSVDMSMQQQADTIWNNIDSTIQNNMNNNLMQMAQTQLNNAIQNYNFNMNLQNQIQSNQNILNNRNIPVLNNTSISNNSSQLPGAAFNGNTAAGASAFFTGGGALTAVGDAQPQQTGAPARQASHNLSGSADNLPAYQWGDRGLVCMGNTIELCQAMNDGRLNLPNPENYTYNREMLEVRYNDGSVRYYENTAEGRTQYQTDLQRHGGLASYEVRPPGTVMDNYALNDAYRAYVQANSGAAFTEQFLSRGDTNAVYDELLSRGNGTYQITMHYDGRGHIISAQVINGEVYFGGNYHGTGVDAPIVRSGQTGLTGMTRDMGYQVSGTDYRVISSSINYRPRFTMNDVLEGRISYDTYEASNRYWSMMNAYDAHLANSFTGRVFNADVLNSLWANASDLGQELDNLIVREIINPTTPYIGPSASSIAARAAIRVGGAALTVVDAYSVLDYLADNSDTLQARSDHALEMFYQTGNPQWLEVYQGFGVQAGIGSAVDPFVNSETMNSIENAAGNAVNAVADAAVTVISNTPTGRAINSVLNSDTFQSIQNSTTSTIGNWFSSAQDSMIRNVANGMRNSECGSGSNTICR